jgi:hypothetical protein
MPRIIVPPSSGSSPPGVDSGQLGFYAPALAPFANQATVAMSNRAFFWRVVCPLSQTISKIGFSVVNAASVDDQCDVGIYNAACSQLLGSSGATSGKLTTTGAKTVPLLTPVALVAGQVYYAALSFGVIGGTAAQLTSASMSSGLLSGLFGTTPPNAEVATQIPLFPLSAPASPTTGAQNNPILALMQ